MVTRHPHPTPHHLLLLLRRVALQTRNLDMSNDRLKKALRGVVGGSKFDVEVLAGGQRRKVTITDSYHALASRGV